MNWLLNLPLEARTAAVFVAGLAAGGFVNWAIYSLAYFPRAISPWAKPPADAPPRQLVDRLPIIGWLGLRREAPIHGRGFWIRPLLLELALAAGLAALYVWEVRDGLLPELPGVLPPPVSQPHLQFLAHAILIVLMTAATFIDFDEQTIPDRITLPGTLLGLILAAALPESLLPIINAIPAAPEGLLFSSPSAFPASMHTWRGLAIACAGFVGWCAALVPATSTARRGWGKGMQYYLASITRRRYWPKYLALALVGCVVLATVWVGGGKRWEALFSAVAGLVFGGGLIWAVRIVGRLALRKEAMGFGDVTLMAMIGAYLGWQSTLIVFFLSPAAAVIIAVTNWIITRRRDIAFGPYLCLAAVFVIVFWAPIWMQAMNYFALGWMLQALLAACLLLMLGGLMLWRLGEQALFGQQQ